MSTEHIDLAETYLKGEALENEALKELVESLKTANQFALARRVLDLAADDHAPATQHADVGKHGVWLQQQRALCTYKDTEHPPLQRFREALGILRGIGLFDPATHNAETLGLGGAIFNCFWDQEGNVNQLHSALSLYRAGWERDREDDEAPYCGVNAAFLLDQLAQLAERAAKGVAGDGRSAGLLRAEARALRGEILSFLDTAKRPPASPEHALRDRLIRAELHFGLGDYVAAANQLEQAKTAGLADWQAETCARQLINLARCQNLRPSAAADAGSATRQAWQALEKLLGEHTDAACGLVRGRVGLALSGGGFRASFYHLGTLARLAEVDALRHVEAISTVSGGSIVGVLYYLELKQLLESKADEAITREDYLKLIERIQRHFFDGVGRNLRMRTLADLWCNLKMLLPGYSRSHRIGELYEDEIYAGTGDGQNGRRTMADLLISPAGHDAARPFKPNLENWLRRAKVPILLVNATSLNSGHNFQFTASWMGEPPGLVGDEIDMNARYRRVYYREAPSAELKHYPLGHAVGASACVPVLFEPLTIRSLYPGRTVRLVDGGVHDNQGVGGLLDENCNFVICSDASGQMHDQSAPGSSLLGTALRSNEIAQDRVRETQYADLAARERNGALRGLLFMHLKDGLDPAPIAPIGEDATPTTARPNQTPYGIDRDIQRRLSEIRTDLDSFTEVEAQSLMLSGYRATDWQLRHENERHARKGGQGNWGDFDIDGAQGDWDFLKLSEIAGKAPDSTDLRRHDLEKQLTAGKSMFFKAFLLIPWLKVVAIGLGAALLLMLAWLAYECRQKTLIDITWGDAIGAAALLAVAAVLPLLRFLNPQSAARNLLLTCALPLAGWLVANIHLCLIDPLYLKRGRIARLLKLPAERNHT